MIFTPRSHVCIYIYILKKNCDDLVGGRPGCSRWLHLVGMLSMAGLVVALPPATGPKQKDCQTSLMRKLGTHGWHSWIHSMSATHGKE